MDDADAYAIMARTAELLAQADAERAGLLADIQRREAQIEMEAATQPQPVTDWMAHQRALESMAKAAAASTPRPPPPPPPPQPPPPIDWRAWGEAIAQLVDEDISSRAGQLQAQVDALRADVDALRAEIRVRADVDALRQELEQLRQERRQLRAV